MTGVRRHRRRGCSSKSDVVVYLENDLTYNHYIHMPYIFNVTNYFRSEVTAKNCRQFPLRRLQVGFFSRESFKRRSPNFTGLSGTTGPTNLLDMTSLVASGRLQNAINYCTKVLRKMGPGSQSVGHCLYTILTKCCMRIYANLVFSHTGCDFTSCCFRSAFIEVRKTAWVEF